MAFLFGKSKRSPSDLLKQLQGNLLALLESDSSDEKNFAKAAEKVTSALSEIKFMFYGDGDSSPKVENTDKLAEGFLGSKLLLELLAFIQKFEFEARKDVAQIYNWLLRQKRVQAVQYVHNNPKILALLIDGYRKGDVALSCGSILRECVRHQSICELIFMKKDLFNPFFEFVQLPTFDVASDAFATFKLLLTKHKGLVAKFLEDNFDDVFLNYNGLLESKNYVTKRQSLKLLGELLLDRTNFKVMMKYINSADNLKIMMNLLRGTTKAIQFEAFHVFKIFVANPKKAAPIIEILLRNRDKLTEFLKKFQSEKEDEQFAEEKRILLVALSKLNESMLGDSKS